MGFPGARNTAFSIESAEESPVRIPLPAEERPVLRFSTAGSVDDGKSTLLGRLLHDTESLYDDHLEAIKKASAKDSKPGTFSFALLTDGLKAEREQGITIDVAYRYFSTERRHFIMADTPGHEQYTRNMATGASTAELTVILIDARKGVLTQTRRHAFIASLLGVSQFVVAVNKMDLVEYSKDVFDKICKEFLEFAGKLGITNVIFIPMSALLGENVVQRGGSMPWYEGSTLLECLEDAELDGYGVTKDFRLPVQIVLKDKSDYRGYSGKIASGQISVGDRVLVLPANQATEVSRIETHSVRDGAVAHQTAYAPMSISLVLKDHVDVGRGSIIVPVQNAPQGKLELEAMVVWMAETPLDPHKTYTVRHTCQESKVIVKGINYKIDMHSLAKESATFLSLNEIGRISFSSAKPLFVDSYRENRSTGNFILIDPESNATVAAGMVVDKQDYAFLPDLTGKSTTSAPPVSTHIHREVGAITRSQREKFIGFPAMTLWFTGLSGAGKSALAKAIERKFLESGRMCYRLDGDNLRFGLNRDLGFSPEDRVENIRRVAEVSQLLNDAGITTLCSFISPYIKDREKARQIIGTDRFVEIYVNAPLEVCESRDPKGLYQKARKGEIKDFTGISSPYEAPQSPELVIDTARLAIDECVEQMLQYVIWKAPRIS